ncbi:MAG: hypothetical protein FJZ04_04450 [Candidatus Moranbacteria bacterium]|nr:hypothetical protein [Candidatus Moranbacteria bacterium]
MGNRIAKFLVAVPLTASMIVNTNVEPKTNTKIKPDSINNSSLQVSETPDSQTDGVVVVKEKNAEIESRITVTDKQENEKPENGKMVSEKQLEIMEKMVAGYPIAKMLPYIAKRDPVTAAFLVSIAKKESNWGKVSPRGKNGDCFNYWGFKDRKFPFVAGHSCFPSAEAAVEAVGNRIDKLVANGRNTPAELVVWKCGSACAKDGNAGKWISDVNKYFRPIASTK